MDLQELLRLSMDLINASGDGDLDTVQRLIHEGVDPNVWQGEALVRAAKEGRLEVVDHLILEDVNVDSQGGLPLIEAAGAGHLDVVEYLLQAGSRAINDAISRAATEQEWDMVKYLIEQDADPTYALLGAVDNGDKNMVRELILAGADLNHDPEELVKTTIYNGDLSMLLYLNRKGIRYPGKDVLVYALNEGELEIASFILDSIHNPLQELGVLKGDNPPILLDFLKKEYAAKVSIKRYLIQEGGSGALSHLVARYY